MQQAWNPSDIDMEAIRERLKTDPRSAYVRGGLARRVPVDPAAVARFKAYLAAQEQDPSLNEQDTSCAESKEDGPMPTQKWCDILTKERCIELVKRYLAAEEAISINWLTEPAHSGLPRRVTYPTLKRYLTMYGLLNADNQPRLPSDMVETEETAVVPQQAPAASLGVVQPHYEETAVADSAVTQVQLLPTTTLQATLANLQALLATAGSERVRVSGKIAIDLHIEVTV